MRSLLTALRHTRLLHPGGLVALVEAVLAAGVNPAALLRFAARRYPARTALVDERERLTYRQLWEQAEALAGVLHAGYGVGKTSRVAVACRTHAAAVKALFACARLGADVFVVDPTMPPAAFRALRERHGITFCVFDAPLAEACAAETGEGRALASYHAEGGTTPSIDRLAVELGGSRRLPATRGGWLVVMTGGTTGVPKAVGRTPSLLRFLPPFVALLEQVGLHRYRRLYVATPMHHGFGLAALLIGVLLGGELYVLPAFEAGRACALVARHRVEAMTVVPLMLQRMLDADPAALASLRAVLCGSAPLGPALAQEAQARLGSVLFNLYGTSEGGVALVAPPETLALKPGTVGRPVRGVRLRIVDEAGNEVSGQTVGQVALRSSWSARPGAWVETGDLGHRDNEGDVFLCGRVDDMIVSGGENVYPVELENVLALHSDLAEAVAVGVPDAAFGQRLKAFVVVREGRAVDAAALLAWLKPRAARHQMPVAIEVRDALPYTPLGKPDRRALR